MKFNYLATILMGTVALASNFNAGPANASDCKIIAVPWEWKLTKSGDSPISVDAVNTGDSFTTVPHRLPFGGEFNVKLDFNPPDQFCDQYGSAPTQIMLDIIGTFTGELITSFKPVIGNPLDPRLIGPFATAEASVDILPPFDIIKLVSGRVPINEPQQKRRYSVQDGQTISFAGVLEGKAYKGEDTPESIGFSRSKAELDIKGVFEGETSGTVIYAVATPEPLTMLASATAVGFGAFFKRQHSKNQKKS